MASRVEFAKDGSRMAALKQAYDRNLRKGTPDFCALDEEFGFWTPDSGSPNKGWHTWTLLKGCGYHVPGRKPVAHVQAAVPRAEPSNHPEYANLRTLVKGRIKVMLVGPTGSGKTIACRKIAKELGLEFLPQSFCNQTPESRFAGYMDANGRYIESGFYRVFKHGGLYLFDEMDAANPNCLTAFNAAVENRVYTFPNGEFVEAHPDFACVGAANTFGTGASLDYQRNRLDGATLKRFLKLAWGYDEAHEMRIAPRGDWTRHVQKARRAAERIGLRIMVSPHDSIYGGQALDAGLPWAKVEEMSFLAGLDEPSVAKLRAEMRKAS